jgi:hypothetical protein
MDFKLYLILFLVSIILLLIFNKCINRYVKDYKPWNSDNVLNKIKKDILDIDISNEKPKRQKNEERCREIFQDIFKQPFAKIRPDFLKNKKSGKNLELDGYNKDLKLAFEYQGAQHYNFTPYFHKTQEHFADQVYRDKLKQEICDEQGITLIVIPYNVPYQDLRDYIELKLSEVGYDI